MTKQANAAKKTSTARPTEPVAAKKTVRKSAGTPATKAVKSANPAPAPKATAEKQKKPKLVRDSFTMPENEYALITQVKKACVSAGFEIKKSELLRIGITLLAAMDPKKLQTAQQALTPLKTGRPKKK